MQVKMKLGRYLLQDESGPLFIGEIGTAHGGNINKAYELIDALKESGAHFAKFQHVIADEIIHPKTGLVSLPGGDTPLYSVFKSLEKGPDFFADLKEYCQKKDISFLCTPFGPKSASDLRRIGVDAVKVASPELNHFQLLKQLDSYGLPLILSTGVSMLSDIEHALAVLSKKPVLLHCITSYPAPEEEYNIRLVQLLSGIFGCFTGISDHSKHPYLVPALAALYGGKIIEKHITLRNSDKGLDDAIALTPERFREMVDTVDAVMESGFQIGLEQMETEFGAGRIRAVLGDGVKKLAGSEIGNYGRTNRSVHALFAIKKGDTITADNIAVLRTEKKLRPGLPPDFIDFITGSTAVRDIREGEGIVLEDILSRNETEIL